MASFYRKLLPLFFLVIAPGLKAHEQGDGLVFMYNDLDPYIISGPTGITGFLADYLKEVTDHAAVTPLWRNIPWDKQLSILKRNQPNVCAIALFKTKDRESYARFTAAIGSDERFVLISIKEHKALMAHQTFRDVVNDKNLRPILQQNTVYSAYINDLLDGKGFGKTKGSTPRMARTLITGVHDYIIITRLMAESLIAREALQDQLAVYDHYTDLNNATPEPYFIACSLKTEDHLFESLNRAILHRGIVKPQ